MRIFIVALLCLVALPVAADPLVERYGSVMRSCYDAGGGLAARAACEGAMTQACVTSEPGGESTIGIADCMIAEHSVWDGYLNAEYRTTRDWARGIGAGDALLAAQRAWIAYRDAECALAYAAEGGGSIRVISGALCLRAMTAQRTLDLVALREGAMR